MRFQEFLVPSDDEILDAFGVEPEAESGEEPWIRVVRIPVGDHDVVTLSYDIVGHSFACRWHRDDVEIVRLFREAATQLNVGFRHGGACATVHFATESLSGALQIQVYPEILIDDRLLH